MARATQMSLRRTHSGRAVGGRVRPAGSLRSRIIRCGQHFGDWARARDHVALYEVDSELLEQFKGGPVLGPFPNRPH